MPKWLCIPPAVALLLVLGPLSMQGGSIGGSNGPNDPTTSNAATKAKERTTPSTTLEDPVRPGRTGPVLPRTPDLWQMTSALVGVLLLGVGAVLVMRKLRGGAAPPRGAAPLATLRQTLRLSSRQAIHAIEFDDRILLVGQHDRGLVLLDSGRVQNATSDEEEVVARHAHTHASMAADEDDEGAVPKDLVIPRPPQPAAPRPIQRPTQGLIQGRAQGAPRAPAAPTLPAKKAVGLNDFRTLLQKVGR